MIELKQATLFRGIKAIFSEASLRLFPGWHVGICGENGAGKSSFFALLQGNLGLSAGDLVLPAHWTIASMAQEVESSEQSALEYVLDGDTHFRQIQRRVHCAEAAAHSNLDADLHELALAHADFAALGGYETPSRASALLHGLGFSNAEEQHPVQSFSGGWRMRLGLAQALMCRSDVLMLDEPTNHLDLDALLWLESWLQSYPGLLLLISHDREFLDGVCGHIVLLAHEELRYYPGNYSRMEQARAEQLVQLQQMRQKQELERAHLRSFIDRFRAQATKARQAQSRIKRLEKLELIAPLHVDSPFRFAFRAPERMPRPLLSLQEGQTGYPGAPVSLSQLELQLNPGDRIGILGRNGAGKSTLLKLLAGELPLLAGKMHQAQPLKIAYFHQHQLDAFAADDTPLLCMQRLAPQTPELQLRQFLGGFGFSGERVSEACHYFSGGERARLALALCAWQQPQVLLLDEPTNHLDIEMRLALNLALQAFTGALVLISHDRTLLASCCDTLLLVDAGRCQLFNGDVEDYAVWLQQKQNSPTDASTADVSSGSVRKTDKRQQAQQRQQLRPLRLQLQQTEKKLEELQYRLKQVSAELADESLYQPADKPRLLQTMALNDTLSQSIAALEIQWLELSEQLEQHANP